MKEILKKLGLTDEQITQTIEAHNDVIKNAYVPLARMNEINETNKSLNTQIQDFTTKVAELAKKATTTEELQTKYAELETNFNNQKLEFDNKLKETAINSALKVNLSGKVHDVDLVAGLLDKSLFELDDKGNIVKGLEDQVKVLQESKAFLFVPEKQPEADNPFGFRQAPPKIGADITPKPSELGSLEDAISFAMNNQK